MNFTADKDGLHEWIRIKTGMIKQYLDPIGRKVNRDKRDRDSRVSGNFFGAQRFYTKD